VINDAYNANPSSMRAALQAFLESPENGLKRILVLGAMNELGEFSQSYHEELGRWLAAQTGIEALYLVGEEAQWVQATCTGGRFPVYQAATAQEAATQLAGSGQSLENHLLFLKGSRSFQLEAIPEALSTVSSMSGGAR
jgi:UDP-N-acetylmuramoyl-tripeptide--D-alanyl-D-alanine ligase